MYPVSSALREAYRNAGGSGCRTARTYRGPVRVLVTGGAGFIGSHVADRLAAEGHEPLLLDALLPEAHGDRPPLATDGHELVRGDVRDAVRGCGSSG